MCIQSELTNQPPSQNGSAAEFIPHQYRSTSAEVQAALAGPHGQQAAAYVTLQNQLAETQSSLAHHLSKIRDLEGQVQGHEATRQEVSQVKEQMEETKREMDLLLANTRGRQRRVWNDDDEPDDDDDTKSIATVMPDDDDEERPPTNGVNGNGTDLVAQNAELVAKVESMSAEIADVIQLTKSLQTQHGEALSAVQALTERLGALETGFTSRVAEEVSKTEQKWESWKTMFEDTHRKDRETWEAERERLRGVVREWEEASRRAHEEEEERELNEELSGEEEEVADIDSSWKNLDEDTPTFAQTRKGRRRRPSHRASLAIDALKAVADGQGSSTPTQLLRDSDDAARHGLRARALKSRKGNLPRTGSASTIRDDKESSDSGKESGGTLRDEKEIERSTRAIAQVSICRTMMDDSDHSANYHNHSHCRRCSRRCLPEPERVVYVPTCCCKSRVLVKGSWMKQDNDGVTGTITNLDSLLLHLCIHVSYRSLYPSASSFSRLASLCIMVNYLRELVSGKKARYIDHESATNLDLVYVTDRILM